MGDLGGRLGWGDLDGAARMGDSDGVSPGSAGGAARLCVVRAAEGRGTPELKEHVELDGQGGVETQHLARCPARAKGQGHSTARAPPPAPSSAPL
jgi:hypothetical protein